MHFSLITIAALVTSVAAGPMPKNKKYDDYKDCKGRPTKFTSYYEVKAFPNQVVDANNTYTGGLKGCEGLFKYAINKDDDTICYDITLYNFRGEYQSPALTATHIHQGPEGKAGPPRLAFPNPKPIGKKGVSNSKGCLKGPFKTGVMANGMDTGDGFKVEAIEKDPKAFFTDSHSSLAVPGAVRGQLKK